MSRAESLDADVRGELCFAVEETYGLSRQEMATAWVSERDGGDAEGGYGGGGDDDGTVQWGWESGSQCCVGWSHERACSPHLPVFDGDGGDGWNVSVKRMNLWPRRRSY